VDAGTAVGHTKTTGLRLAELMAAISLATDLQHGYPLETGLRRTLLAVGLARELGLEGQDLSDVYYTALLEQLGCTGGAHELAAFVRGDEIAALRAGLTQDPRIIGQTILGLARQSPLHAAALVTRSAVAGARMARSHLASACESADRLARRLGMSNGVLQALGHAVARWDGWGIPLGIPPISGESIALPARITSLAVDVAIHLDHGGHPAALAMVRQRTGKTFDPIVARTFLQHADALLALIEVESVWDAAIAAEPEPRPWLPGSRLDQVAQAFADFVDLKSPYTLSHSTGVARIADSTAQVMGFDDAATVAVKRAGLLHDLGRVSVPNGIWDKRGPLTHAEWERVRLHPYYSERILMCSPVLKALAQTAGMHHERLDGSGYHHGVSASSLPKAARVLCAADAYQAMTEERPHRQALSPAQAAAQLSQEAKNGRLDREVVDAVLVSVGQTRARERAAWPAALTEREVQVLRLVAQAKSEKEIAKQLFISINTVHHHVKQIYEKTGVSTRAGAALFAMENDLILH
jgi:HD-GYP domain-containing protein (c-di-GMP phosphodiesterase class II)